VLRKQVYFVMLLLSYSERRSEIEKVLARIGLFKLQVEEVEGMGEITYRGAY
jgi:hypothetical protein